MLCFESLNTFQAHHRFDLSLSQVFHSKDVVFYSGIVYTCRAAIVAHFDLNSSRLGDTIERKFILLLTRISVAPSTYTELLRN